jgi:hypothetical protein
MDPSTLTRNQPCPCEAILNTAFRFDHSHDHRESEYGQSHHDDRESEEEI